MRSLHAIRAADGALLWRSSLARPAFGAPTFARGVLFVPSTLDLSVKAFDVNTFDPASGEPLLLWEHPLDGAPSSAPAIVWDSIYLGGRDRRARDCPSNSFRQGIAVFPSLTP